MDMLQKLLEKDISFAELRERTLSFRALEANKTALMQTTNSSNWDTESELLPHHANMDRIRTITYLSFKGTYM